jgi:DNA-binding NtrC family response regulator
MATILVTDDDTACRETILKTLEREGHTLQSASNVDAAIQAVKREQFDLIVCDYRMPGKTGLDLLRELDDLGFHVPVLLVSAFADTQTETTAKKFGAIALLRKPFRRQELIEHTARAIPSPQNGSARSLEPGR